MIGKIKVDTNGIEGLGCTVIHSKEKGKTTGWIGYTLSFSNRKFEGVNFDEVSV